MQKWLASALILAFSFVAIGHAQRGRGGGPPPAPRPVAGNGVEVPGWVYFLVFVIFGLFLFLALVVFPMPLAPKAPPGLRAEEAAAATTDGSAS